MLLAVLDEARLKKFSKYKVLNGIKTLLVIAVSYKPAQNIYESALLLERDYHERVSQILRAIADPRPRFYLQVDAGIIKERELAQEAGLGFIGKNYTLISKELGSFFNIGILGLYENLNGDILNFNQNACPDNCRLCIDACPSGALETKDFRRCSSHISQKRRLEKNDLFYLHTIYGCEICQQVCPFNKKFLGKISKEFPDKWTKTKDFWLKEKAAAWRGAKIIRRNAAIIKKRLRNL